jgi:lipoprotein-releasing system permease protein
MFKTFAWRYFRSKKNANAINIIAWLSVAIIAIAVCAQVVVLSVFNGFEDLVKSLYSSFYTELKVTPVAGKTFLMDSAVAKKITSNPNIAIACFIVEEKALLKNEDAQTIVNLKAVDNNYKFVNDLSQKIISGAYDIGSADDPKLIVGSGVQDAGYINVSASLPASTPVLILPKKTESTALEANMSEALCTAAGVFAIQQEIDAKYAITNIDFVKQQMGLAANEFSAIEIKMKNEQQLAETTQQLEALLGINFTVQNRYQQNANLYSTMQKEKWFVYFVLTLILVIAAFNIISVLTMLVLEKQKDISILSSMGLTNAGVQKIFLHTGLLLAAIGGAIGIILSLTICGLQQQFKLIKLAGSTFLIDYFPVKIQILDIVAIVATTAIIALIASWFPAKKATDKISLQLK